MPKRYSVGERAVRLPRDGSETRGAAYLDHPRDAVRDTFETAFFARELDRLLKETGPRRVAALGAATASSVGSRASGSTSTSAST